MLDKKTLETLDEAIHYTLGVLVEEDGLSTKSPLVQKFLQARQRIQTELDSHTLRGKLSQKQGR